MKIRQWLLQLPLKMSGMFFETHCSSQTSSCPATSVRPSRRVTVDYRSFATAGPRIWNTLPRDVTTATSLLSFRRKLKTHLFRQSCWHDMTESTQRRFTKRLLEYSALDYPTRLKSSEPCSFETRRILSTIPPFIVDFNALHGMQTRSSDEMSVRLSVKHLDFDTTEERSDQMFIPYESSFSIVFWEEEWLVGVDHFYLKCLVNRPPLERNRRFWADIRS